MSAAAATENPAPPRVLLSDHLRQLKLPTILHEYEKVAQEAARNGQDHVRYLLRLVELELINRERRIRAARIPAVKSFDTFDFVAIPSLNKPLVLELARCEYATRAMRSVCFGSRRSSPRSGSSSSTSSAMCRSRRRGRSCCSRCSASAMSAPRRS